MQLQTFDWAVMVGIGALAGTGALIVFFTITSARARLVKGRRPLRVRELVRHASGDPSRIRDAIGRPALLAKEAVARIPTAKRRQRMERELFAALGVLRNHAKAGSGAKLTVDAILEGFASRDGAMKGVWASCLRLLRVGRAEEIPAYFEAATGAGLARDFMMLLLEWDHLAPERLTDTISAFQAAMKESRTTQLMRANEVLSDIIYLPVVTGVLVVFMNFVYVTYFVEQKELLTELFF
ncbi:MAG: hypothetical protein LBR44_08555 [Clostridiales Family XIII bacterium]|nr:hypothetical protein [Clostridiales Family XIII bacterium]